MNLDQFTQYHKDHFKDNVLVVCIDCLSEYHSNKIKDWCDDRQTAICPYCWDDTVLLSPKHTTNYTNEDIVEFRKTFMLRDTTIHKQITFVDDETYSINDLNN